MLPSNIYVYDCPKEKRMRQATITQELPANKVDQITLIRGRYETIRYDTIRYDTMRWI